MYKKVFKGHSEYYAIYIEDINNLVGDLTAIIGTTKKEVFSHNEFDSYVTLYSYNSPNLIVDAVESHGRYLAIYKLNEDNYSFEIYYEDDFENTFIDEIDLKELANKRYISFEEFKENLDFIKEQDEKMNNFCDALEQLSPGEYCNCFLYAQYEEKLLNMLCLAMSLTKDKINTLSWWLYDMEWGTKVNLDSCDVDLTTIEKLYNYLIGE